MLVAVGISLVLGGCGSDMITDPSQVVFPESNVSFGRHVLPVLELGCTDSGCHNEFDRAGNVSLKSYFDLFSRPGLVRPGDSTTSVLAQIVGGRLPHFEAPIARILNANQRRGIQIWIQEGASNN